MKWFCGMSWDQRLSKQRRSQGRRYCRRRKVLENSKERKQRSVIFSAPNMLPKKSTERSSSIKGSELRITPVWKGQCK